MSASNHWFRNFVIVIILIAIAAYYFYPDFVASIFQVVRRLFAALRF